MANAVFGYTNRVTDPTTTLTAIAGSEAAGLGVSQLKNDQGAPSTAWQTLIPGASLRIATTTTASTWQAFGVFRTNLSGNSTAWRIRVGNDPTFASWSYDSGNQLLAVAPGFGQGIAVLPSVATGQYALIEINDTLNPDNYLNIPLVYAGPVWQLITNPSFDSSVGRDDQTDEVVSRGGQEFPALQYVRRRWDVALEGLRDSEQWTTADALDRFARTGSNVLYVPEPASSRSNQKTVFGRCKTLSDITFPYGNSERRAWKLRMTERL